MKNKILDYLWGKFPNTMNTITYNNLTILGKLLVLFFIVVPLATTICIGIMYVFLILTSQFYSPY